MSPTSRVGAALAAGLALGTAAHATGSPVLLAIAAGVEPLGTLWVHAILATVVPLVVAGLVVGVTATGDLRLVGRYGRGTAGLFVLLATGSATLTALIGPPLFAWLPVSAAPPLWHAGAGSAASSPVVATTLREWLVGIIPSNPVRAAADGSLLPLVVFTLAFALALVRVERAPREALVRGFAAVMAATRVLISWVLALAPVGIFALVLPLASRVGISTARALASYVALRAVLSVAIAAAVYPLAVVGGRVSLRRFARAAAPAQAVALGSRSSLASLPALMDGAERQLGVPPAISGFCLPLAVSTFKYAAPNAMLMNAFFLGRLGGVPLHGPQVAQAAAASILLSFAVPGVPGGALLVATPVFVALGVPVDVAGILFAVDTIPEMFSTLANVTADLAVAAVVGRPSTAPAWRASVTVARVARRAWSTLAARAGPSGAARRPAPTERSATLHPRETHHG
ncbi:MAG TPA: cation:dicarboxylase symporter family transporter [Gemmatirosa sp.]